MSAIVLVIVIQDPHTKKGKCWQPFLKLSTAESGACFPGSGQKEELGKMEEPGLNFCRARFAIVL